MPADDEDFRRPSCQRRTGRRTAPAPAGDPAQRAAARKSPTEDTLPSISLSFGDVVRASPDAGMALPLAYDGPEVLGRGGMGEVFRVRDAALGRSVALKTCAIPPGQPAHRYERFLREARTTARLQHPGIIAVHEVGQLPDGRPYYTMPVVQGAELAGLIRAHHTGGEPSLRALVTILRRACEPLAYAHERQVVHRDLKPQNVMVGAHGEVLVLDWGIARKAGDPSEGGPGDSFPDEDDPLTRTGAMLGTPGYMAPEQVGGGPLTPQTDVHALGAVLFEILTGIRPRSGPAQVVLGQTLMGTGLLECSGPQGLRDLALRCLAFEPSDRPADARALGDALQGWLDGAERRAEADREVERADALAQRAQALRAASRRDADRADALLESAGPWAPEDAKAPGWALEDAARGGLREADRLLHEREQALWAALSRDPSHLAARSALAHHFRDAHQDAEHRRDAEGAARARVALESQLPHLPAEERTRHTSYLVGRGTLTLHTEPTGARVTARPFVEHHRRLVEGEPTLLGVTPLADVPLDAGSWMLELAHPDCEPVGYPVALERSGAWDTTPPDGPGPEPVPLPPHGSLGPDEVYVAPGWFTAGGDPEAPRSLPETRFWCHGFVMTRAPVTNAEWLVFLDALTERGDLAAAERCCPQDWQRAGDAAERLWDRGPDGRWRILPDKDGDLWQPDWPVIMIDFHAAVAYASWRADRDGLPWRLPAELEWEKAARGVDQRAYPWGNHLDPTWASITFRDGRAVTAAHETPIDRSPYGLLQMGGCVAEWVLEGRSLPDPTGPRVIVPEVDPTDDGRVARGGSWNAPWSGVRSAQRGLAPTHRGMYTQGFRLVRAWPEPRAQRSPE